MVWNKVISTVNNKGKYNTNITLTLIKCSMCCKFSYISNYLVTGKIQIKGTCSGTYDNNKQEITSPNYPRNYHNSKTCTWKLEAPQGRRIGLKFLDFDLEQSSGCRYDWLKVYNGGSDSSPVLKDKLCGTSRPSNTMKGIVVIVHFCSFIYGGTGKHGKF